mmetsp:Transcript_31125/g.78616  ORF Transcript_31125/g.78616 Transcript_31125/m.78616 type:complete len:233 (+) Transcript_31125:912-1610(+)
MSHMVLGAASATESARANRTISPCFMETAICPWGPIAARRLRACGGSTGQPRQYSMCTARRLVRRGRPYTNSWLDVVSTARAGRPAETKLLAERQRSSSARLTSAAAARSLPASVGRHTSMRWSLASRRNDVHSSFTLTSNTATLGSRWRDEPSGWPTSSAAGRGGCRAAAASGGLSLPSEPLELGRRAAGVAGVPFAALLGSLPAPAGAEMSGMGALAVGWRAPLPMPSSA